MTDHMTRHLCVSLVWGWFEQEMVTKLSTKMTTDGMTDLVNHTNVFLDEKRQADKRIATAKANASNVQATQRANKKKIAKKKVRRALRLGRHEIAVRRWCRQLCVGTVPCGCF